jgi:hypothetical protein
VAGEGDVGHLDGGEPGIERHDLDVEVVAAGHRQLLGPERVEVGRFVDLGPVGAEFIEWQVDEHVGTSPGDPTAAAGR